MMKPWIRGILTLGILGALAGSLLLSPAGAAAPVTKKKVKKIATKVANNVVNAKALPNTVIYRRSDLVNVPAGGEAGAFVACPAGTVVVSGGFVGQTRLDNPSSSYPSNGATLEKGHTGWAVFHSNFSGAPHQFRAIAICVRTVAIDSDYPAGGHPLTT
jgi:hypothetical protein